MAWFGEGFSSLKGQITNFTKEMVANNIVPLDDTDDKEDSDKLRKLNTHVQHLEAHCKEQDEEINKLRIENLQLRKASAEGSSRDRHHSEEATFECDSLGLPHSNIPLTAWEEDVVAEPFLGQENASYPVNNAQKAPKDPKMDEEIISLRIRLRKTFQEKVLLEQSCSRLEKDVALLSQQVNKTKHLAEEEARRNADGSSNLGTPKHHQSTQTGDISKSSSQNCHCVTPELSSLLEENDRLKQERILMRQEMATMTRVVQDLESQVAVSQDENSNLSTGLEELDIRHQQEIEQIMNLKDSSQKRYELLLAEHDEMKKQYEGLIEEHTRMKHKLSISIETQTEGTNIKSSDDIRTHAEEEVMKKLDSIVTISIPEEYFENNVVSENCVVKITALVSMCEHLRDTVARIEKRTNFLIQEIKDREEESQGLESENITLREKLQEFSKERESLPPIYENSEEFEVLEHKCSSLENENAILIEMRSNLEAEINKLRSELEMLGRRLQGSDAEIKNQENLQTEIVQYREIEAELRKKINEMSIENETILQQQHDLITKRNEELECNMKKLDEVIAENKILNEELTKIKESEIQNKNCKEELELEKFLRMKAQFEKEELSCECSKLNDKLEQENQTKLQLEEEKLKLSKDVSRLLEIENLYQKAKEELKVELLCRKQVEEEKQILHSKLEAIENQMKHFDTDKDSKLQSMMQKYSEIESELLLLSEKFDSLKIENDSKDRKLCEVILEKSVLEKETEHFKKISKEMSEEITKLKLVNNELETNSSTLVKNLEEQLTSLQNENTKYLQENSLLKAELDEVKHQLSQLVVKSHSNETSSLEVQTARLQDNCLEVAGLSNVNQAETNVIKDELAKLQVEKDQLIQTLQAKHIENIQYHGEIQRLNTLLSAQLNKTDQVTANCTALTQTNQSLKQKLEDKDEQQTANDKQISMLNQQVETLQNQLEYVSQLLRVADRQEAEGQPASESPSLKTPLNKAATDYNVDELLESLKQEQLRNKYLQNEVQEQHEKEQGSLKEIERLRVHLMSVEDNYTQELLRAEEQVKELQLRLSQAEERVKSSSTAYTSASIRANQQVESLGKQVRLLSEQKEKILAQLAAAEDKLHKQAAALTNLQLVLEQFQRDKEKDIGLETERIKQTLQQAENKNADLCNEIKSLQMQLKEVQEGLSAASRLNEQLDRKSQIITELKQTVSELTDSLRKAEERVHAASLSVEGKVDRCLVRNLIVGYFCAPPGSSRQQALSIVATVLDLSQDDKRKIGLESTSKADEHKQQSLSEAFVRFLENESRPHLKLPLAELDKESRSRKTSLSDVGLPNARKTSGSVLKDVLKQDRLL